MKTIIAGIAALSLLIVVPFVVNGQNEKKGEKNVPSVLSFKMTRLDGKPGDLADYRGKVVLIVNTASECGLTPQYEGLEKLHEKYASKGLVILGFPANEFGQQEPGTNEDIAKFCAKNYGVKFDMFAKVVVKGDGQAPLYQYLTSKETNPKFAGPIKWNFEKFLISRGEQVVARFDPQTEPEADTVVKAIEAELAKK